MAATSDGGGSTPDTTQEILGYLNFSSGAADLRFLANINALYVQLQAAAPRRGRQKAAAGPIWQQLGRRLAAEVPKLQQGSEAFRQADQATAVVHLVFDELLPAYRQFHRDLLFHQTDEALFQPFFLGRACEAVLRQGGPWDETGRIVAGAIGLLNDFIGHRPVAVLRSAQKIQPYAHEWVRPIPLFIRGAGLAAGPYQAVVEKALAILAETAPRMLEQAHLNLEWLDELAVDPRAYDFDHPANKRPNYHFGQWDPHQIDNAGRYRRFVLQQVTLDAIVERLQQRSKTPAAELLFEAGAVLAGTMLMGSGISGWGPGAHDSSTTLATLLPNIAAYRDRFYEELMSHVGGDSSQRLRDEAEQLHQPFGGARQHLNQQLARRRAMQVQHTHLAQFYAWIGYTDAAMRQVDVVPVASARMSCRIRCLITAAHLKIEHGQLAEACAAIPEVEDLLHRAIECGALVDPWNILGFGGQFGLFAAVENSVHDHRVDELIELVSQIFTLYLRLQKEAAAHGEAEMPVRLSEGMARLAQWWDKYASIEVAEVEGFSGREAVESAEHVADALRAWQAGGEASGDVAFWRQHVDQFRSPKAYALVVESLLERHDYVAAMALLLQWLSQAGEIPLAEQDYSFHDLAIGWMDELLGNEGRDRRRRRVGNPPPSDNVQNRWALARKMLDYLEANAEEYWQVPRFDLDESVAYAGPPPDVDGDEEEPEDEAEAESEVDELFAAAYEDVTFRDSTDDGFEGEMIEGGRANLSDYELSLESQRIIERLDFLTTIAWLWRMAATAFGSGDPPPAERQAVFQSWLAQAQLDVRNLSSLLASVERHEIPAPRGTHDSMVEYDHRRALKEQLLEEIIATSVEMDDAVRSLRATIEPAGPAAAEAARWEEPAQRVMRAIFRGDRAAVRDAWNPLVVELIQQPVLYVSLARGGSPQKIVASRSLLRVLARLLAYLPRLGLLEQTFQLLETIQAMEQAHSVGPGAITEFDRLFDIGCKGIIRCLTVSAEGWRKAGDTEVDMGLVNRVEEAVEAVVRLWHRHSRRVRLSILETVADEERWLTLRRFIETYGAELFTQTFMTLGNLRAILHQGVEQWLGSLLDDPEMAEDPLRLLEDLDRSIERAEAAFWLDVAVEAVVENYSAYVDYNSTTTQSDRGEMLYTLLDFLRLLASYNRIAWNLRPVIVAHDVLVRSGRTQEAEVWRLAVRERTNDVARKHLRQYDQLVKTYGMRLPSVAERMEERFVRPMLVDRLRALVGPSIDELREGVSTPAFTQLEKGIGQLLDEPLGVGFDSPRWLEALEDEVEDYRSGPSEEQDPIDPRLAVPEVRLSKQQLKAEIDNIRARV